MKQTLVIGSAVVDVIINIPHLPKTGEDVHISRQSRSLGGCAYIVSDILRHFGVPYSLCTAVGSGIYGDFVRQQLEARNVPIYVRRAEENGCCYCMVEADGERTFIVDHGIEYTFYEEYLKRSTPPPSTACTSAGWRSRNTQAGISLPIWRSTRNIPYISRRAHASCRFPPTAWSGCLPCTRSCI